MTTPQDARVITRDTLAGYVAGLAGRDLHTEQQYQHHTKPEPTSAFIWGYCQGVMHRVGAKSH